jgi:hypothetical protein
MMTLFLKELRENLKWAGVIFGVIGVMIYWNIRRASPILLQVQLPQPTTTLFGAMAGLLMGFVQTLFETRPDNWAFVVHRPVSRWAIFAAKCAAGLLLLYAALGLPCALAGIWAARPGNLPTPFQPRMMLPMLADILTAGCYYFIAMILTLRKARWFGTRLLPIGLGLACTFVANFSESFWMAALFIFAAQAIAALGAWEAFNTGGAAEDRGLPKFALGAAIYCGALGIGVLFVPALSAFQTTSTWRHYTVDRQGKVLIVTKTRSAEELVSVTTDPAGRVLPEYEGVDADDPANASRFITSVKGLSDDRLVPRPQSLDLRGFRSPLPGVIPLRTVAPPNVRLHWVCLFNVPRRIIELYDPTSRSMVGTVGPAGFAPGQSQPRELFPARSFNPAAQNGTHTLAFEQAVYWMELDQRRVRRIYTASADDPVISATELPPAAEATVLVLTHRQIHVLRPSGKARFSVPLTADPASHWFAVAMIPANQHLLVWAGSLLPEADPAFHQETSEYNSGGKLVRRESIPALAPVDTPLVLRRTALFGAIYPLAALPGFSAPIADFIFDTDTQRHGRLFHGFLFASSVLCALATYLLGRRYALSQRKHWAWVTANLLLGPAGIIVLLGLNECPAREICAACGRRRPAARRHCPACRFTAPASGFDGREIFEPADDSSLAALN